MALAAKECFVEAARKHGEATREGDPRKVNKAYKKLVSALRIMRGSDDNGEGVLLSLLDDSDESVAVWAAVYLLPFNELRALEVLQRIAARDIPRISFAADMTLKEWRAGRLKIE